MKLTIDGYQKNPLKKDKYYQWYRQIIINRINNPPIVGENHHIVPRCMGGDDSKNNIIMLSPREHYICHLCLAKITTRDDMYKMLCAVTAMSMKTLKHTFRFNGRIYEKLKLERSLALTEWLKKNSPFKNSEIHKKTMLTRQKNGTNIFVTNNPMLCDGESKRKKVEQTSGKNHYMYGKYKYEYSKDAGNTWLKIPEGLTMRQICKDILDDCSYGSLVYMLEGNMPKRGKYKNFMVRRFLNENYENKEKNS